MRILALTLMLSFLSHSAFGAAKRQRTEGGGAEEYTQEREEGTTFKNVPKEIIQLTTTTFLSLEDLKSFSEASTSSRELAKEAILQKSFALNMKDIERRYPFIFSIIKEIIFNVDYFLYY